MQYPTHSSLQNQSSSSPAMHTQSDTHTHTHRMTRTTRMSSERSDGAYTSAFASRADGRRALRWQERQRAAETEMTSDRRFNRAQNNSTHSGQNRGGTLVWITLKPALPNRVFTSADGALLHWQKMCADVWNIQLINI